MKKTGKGIRTAINKNQEKAGVVRSKGTTKNEDVEHITELSHEKLTAAAKAAEVKRGKKAVAGDREGAKKAIAQNKKFYDAAQAKKNPSGSYKESIDRMKAKMIQFTKDHDLKMQGKQPI